jgi:hypothetical protein
MAAIEIWVIKNLGWLGFVVMCILGSVVAHIKAYEESKVEWTVRKHVWGVIRRLVYGATAGLMVYQLHIEYSISGPLAHVATGVVAIFASDFFDLLWNIVKRRIGFNTEQK